MNLVAQEYGPKNAPTPSRFLKGHPERFLVLVARARRIKKPRFVRGLLNGLCNLQRQYFFKIFSVQALIPYVLLQPGYLFSD